MKITLDGLDGRNFTLRLPRDAGGEHVIALHGASALRGSYEHDASRFSLAPVEADAVVGAIAWTLSDGALELAGPLTLGATRLALEIRRDDRTPGVTGEVVCASFDAPTTRLSRESLTVDGALGVTALHARHDPSVDAWDVTADALTSRALMVARGALRGTFERIEATTIAARHGDATSLSLAGAAIEGLRVVLGAWDVEAARVTLTGVRLSRDAGGVLSLEVDQAELSGVKLTRENERATLRTVTVSTLRHGPGGTSVARIAFDEAEVSVDGLASRERAKEGDAPEGDAPMVEGTPDKTRTLGIDLPFLDHLAGRIEADTEVDVKVPWIERRVASHRMRLTFDDGMIDFNALERGLSKLEDAILDFEVDERGLYFEVDAVVWKRTLLRWPLDARELLHAHQGRVKLRTFARPTVEVAQSPKPGGSKANDGRFALRRVSIDRVKVDLAIRGASALPIASGTLRLGREDAPALGALRVSGSLTHRPSQKPEDQTLAFEVDALDAGLDAIAAGSFTLDLARARVGRLSNGSVTFRGFAPASVAATLGDVSIDALSLRASAP